MSQALIEQLKKSRQMRVESGDVVFVITRPTDLDIAHLRKLDLSSRDVFSKYVVDWDKVTTKHIVSAGDDTPVEFDHDLFLLWIEDHQEHWLPIAQGIKEAWQAHKTRREESEKN